MLIDNYLEGLTKPEELIITFPENSGLFRVVPVEPSAYDPAYISYKENRWNQEGHPNQYLARQLDTCLHELGVNTSTSPKALGHVYERRKANCAIPMLDISKLPKDIQNHIYSVDDNFGKWHNSHLFLTKFYTTYPELSLSGVYAPSASGIVLGYDGICVFTNPEWNHFELQSTGNLSELYIQNNH
jgi:hypothetical protein